MLSNSVRNHTRDKQTELDSTQSFLPSLNKEQGVYDMRIQEKSRGFTTIFWSIGVDIGATSTVYKVLYEWLTETIIKTTQTTPL